MRILPGFAAALLIAHGAGAQAPAPAKAAAKPAGTWRGTSICLVHPSPCNDEVTVYRIAPMQAADSFSIDARKIVRGEEEEMGVLRCRFTPPAGLLTCLIPRSVWLFTVRGDSLFGEVRLADSTKYRDVRAIRAP